MGVLYRFRSFIASGFLLTLILVVHSDESCNLDFEKTLTTLFSPQEKPTIQIRTLRRYLLRLIQSMVAKTEEAEGWNTYVYPKRNLEALARAGYLHTLPGDEEDNQTETQEKRSFSSLVKNGQLPTHHYMDDESNKRSVETVVGSDEFKRQLQRMLDDLYSNVQVPQEVLTKRNLASIARDGGFTGKRNAAALLKNDRYLHSRFGQPEDDKRNIASLKGSYKPKYKRATKIQANYYGNDIDYPVYETSTDDDLVEELLDGQVARKRFLGSIAKTGWYDSPRSYTFGRSREKFVPDKRHIGSLARLGWLPTIRNVRRFSRSGRSSDGTCRETSADGKDEDYYFSENSIPIDNKRFLPVPAMWKVPLQTVHF